MKVLIACEESQTVCKAYKSEVTRMTPEEAISIVKCAIGEVEWNYPIDYAEAIEVAIEALKKQIPKKPHKNYRRLNVKWCECGCYLGELKNEQNYCKNCGQALDWRDTE